MGLTEHQYLYISSVLKKESGLDIGKPMDKEYLLKSRLEPLAETLYGLSCLADLVDKLEKENDIQLVKLIAEAMTTNETFFFRDSGTFEVLEATILPEILKNKKAYEPIRIWSAASSSGQEAYTMIMLLDKMGVYQQGRRVEIVGTDLSGEMVAKARLASYTPFEVARGLSKELLEKYFDPYGREFRLKEVYRNRVQFKEMNLISPKDIPSQLDIIFCRNVLIYFDVELKRQILTGMKSLLSDNGYLILGATESLRHVTEEFQYIINLKGPFYQKGSAAR